MVRRLRKPGERSGRGGEGCAAVGRESQPSVGSGGHRDRMDLTIADEHDAGPRDAQRRRSAIVTPEPDQVLIVQAVSSEEHTASLQSLMPNSTAVFRQKK